MAIAEAAKECRLISNSEAVFDFLEIERALADIIVGTQGVIDLNEVVVEQLLEHKEIVVGRFLLLLPWRHNRDPLVLRIELAIHLQELYQDQSQVHSIRELLGQVLLLQIRHDHEEQRVRAQPS